MPALAVAEALRAEGAEVVFVGGARAEAQLVPAAGFTLHTIAVEGLSRTNPLRALRALALALAALPRARALLKRLAPDAVMGGGGYVAGPVGLAAISLGIPVVLTEADSHLGLTNRMLAPFARRVCLAFPLSSHGGPRYRVTGRPVPAAGEGAPPRARAHGRGPEETRACWCSVARWAHGRSTWRRSMPIARSPSTCFTFAAAANIASWPSASFPPDTTCASTSSWPISGMRSPLPIWSSRARAGPVFEIAAHGLPAILVPYPHATAGHQEANARWMSDGGAAVTIPDRRADAPPPEKRDAGPARRQAPPGGDGIGLAGACPVHRPQRRWPRSCCVRPHERIGGSGERERPWSGRRLHFVGVGGAGMSGYARVAHALGAAVSGSDSAAGAQLERLAADGVLRASVGHAGENVPAGDGVELIYSSAVAADNVERVAARERGIPERPRAELLTELTALRRTIAVAGTHGKTTTASMLVHALRAAGLEPGWLVGGSVGGGLANAAWGGGEWLVVEADESDRSMLSLKVEIAVLTNVELDHHATFASLAELREAFRLFLTDPPFAVIWNRPELLELRTGRGRPLRRATISFSRPAARASPGTGTRYAWPFPAPTTPSTPPGR